MALCNVAILTVVALGGAWALRSPGGVSKSRGFSTKTLAYEVGGWFWEAVRNRGTSQQTARVRLGREWEE
jgi:hypothetical protein